MERKFKKVGYSTRQGVLKLRFTTDVYRQRVLERNGHENINLFDLPEEMDKRQAAEWLLTQKGLPVDVKSLIRAMIEDEDKVKAASTVTETTVTKEPEPVKRGRGRPRKVVDNTVHA